MLWIPESILYGWGGYVKNLTPGSDEYTLFKKWINEHSLSYTLSFPPSTGILAFSVQSFLSSSSFPSHQQTNQHSQLKHLSHFLLRHGDWRHNKGNTGEEKGKKEDNKKKKGEEIGRKKMTRECKARVRVEGGQHWYQGIQGREEQRNEWLQEWQRGEINEEVERHLECTMTLVWKVEWPQCTPQMYIGVRFRKSGQIFKIWPGGYIYDPPKCQIYPPHRECFFDKNWKIFQIYTSIETALSELNNTRRTPSRLLASTWSSSAFQEDSVAWLCIK